jgi:RNA polymerase sigma factor (sigma-70 family)
VPPPDDDRSTALDLAEVVRKLPLRKRECIVLRFYADLSEEETARILGISVGTVKSQTHRALRQLAKELEKSRAAPLDFDPTGRAKDR